MNKQLGNLLGPIFFVLLLLIPALCLPSPQPPWLHQYISGTLDLPGLYCGVGSAPFTGGRPDHEVKGLARDRAVNDLSYRLSVSVKSTFKEQLAQRGEFSDQNVESSLFVTTRLVLSGVEVQETWTDPKERIHWVMVKIDKQRAEKQVGQQAFINEVADRLEGKQDEVLEGVKEIEALLAQQLELYEHRIDQLASLLGTIDSKLEKAGHETKQEYAFLQKEVKRLEQVFQDSQEAKMEELMRQNQVLQDLLAKISHQIDKDYFLSLAQDDIMHKATHPGFWVRIEPDKGQGASYYEGEKIRFHVHASRDCYIKLIYLSSTTEDARSEKRMNTLLFPNTYHTDNALRAGKTMVIGRLGELEIGPPYGKDVITVVASEQQFTDLGETFNQAKGGYYAEVTSNTRAALQMRSRGIAVSKPTADPNYGPGQTPPAPSSVATDTCFIVSHAR